jgi:recombinational DNA repair ATPase RecF
MVLQLEALRIINFKTYQKAKFAFTTGHNVIIGENGAGKSSVFEAF